MHNTFDPLLKGIYYIMYVYYVYMYIQIYTSAKI